MISSGLRFPFFAEFQIRYNKTEGFWACSENIFVVPGNPCLKFFLRGVIYVGKLNGTMNETLPHESAFQGMKVRKAGPDSPQTEDREAAAPYPGAFEALFLEHW